MPEPLLSTAVDTPLDTSAKSPQETEQPTNVRQYEYAFKRPPGFPADHPAADADTDKTAKRTINRVLLHACMRS